MPREDFSSNNKNEFKEKTLEELKVKGIRNFPDFVSLDTYKSIFSRFNLKNAKILDMGAGFSPLTEFASDYSPALPDQDLTLIPVDINELRAKSWKVFDYNDDLKNESKAHPVLANFFHLPFQDNSFDGGISLNVLNSFYDKTWVKLYLAEAYRVLKPGSFIILSSFGYSKMQIGDEVSFNDNFKIEQMIDSNFVTNIAKDLGFLNIEGIPLDTVKMKDLSDAVAQKQTILKGQNVNFGFVNPFALLLIK